MSCLALRNVDSAAALALCARASAPATSRSATASPTIPRTRRGYPALAALHQRRGRLEPPGVLDARARLGARQGREPREHRGPALVVIGDEVHRRLRLDQELLL